MMNELSSPHTIGLLGGTFNPIHNGHLSIAAAAMPLFHLDAVWFLPAAVPPHKSPEGLASNADRLSMLELAIAGKPRFAALPLEFERTGKSYTIDTIRTLHLLHPDKNFVFIIGADTLTELHTWHQPLNLLALVRFVTLARPGSPVPRPEDLHLPPPWPEKLLADFRAGTPLNISSSNIRAQFAAGQLPAELIPEPVMHYIQEHRLYT
ncbi:MAG: nicotinate (nicotinamide) nucleotide adenylyltransferase [Verrucomicrobiota bacterium]|jgi:nicotinate-nucleotide adenylyltransferase|nr:nicotinate (nicotinamide) nucleotide adenylyltransferase [Verrucomicrobiota bacterium]